MAMRYCPDCGKEVSERAAACPGCGCPLRKADGSGSQPVIVNVTGPAQPAWNPGIAVLLSFLIPGVGQMYKGQVVSGFVWLAFVFVGYLLFVFPGMFLHLLCIIFAALGDPYKNTRHTASGTNMR